MRASARHRLAPVDMYSGAIALGANSEVLTIPTEIAADSTVSWTVNNGATCAILGVDPPTPFECRAS